MTERASNQVTAMLERLRCARETGADLSPGDPVCAWACNEIERLQLERKCRSAALREAFGPELWALGHPAHIALHLRQEYAKVERLWKEESVERERLTRELAVEKRRYREDFSEQDKRIGKLQNERDRLRTELLYILDHSTDEYGARHIARKALAPSTEDAQGEVK